MAETCESENSITTDLPYRVCLVNNSCKDHLDKERRAQQDLVVDQDQQYKITLKIEGAFPDPRWRLVLSSRNIGQI